MSYGLDEVPRENLLLLISSHFIFYDYLPIVINDFLI